MNPKEAYCYGPCNQCNTINICFNEMGCVKHLIPSVKEMILRRHSAAGPPPPSEGDVHVSEGNSQTPPRAFEKEP